eukprot:GHUV01042559.1.p2 GENE.GHUV01042559.1~~GHUV01042559.1.p2  ORF type:complete len:101 (+),score=13.12 GHUV01042559.1:34-336(+)
MHVWRLIAHSVDLLTFCCVCPAPAAGDVNGKTLAMASTAQEYVHQYCKRLAWQRLPSGRQTQMCPSLSTDWVKTTAQSGTSVATTTQACTGVTGSLLTRR